jgi:hypothetical protein
MDGGRIPTYPFSVMSGVGAFGLLWAVVGILLGFRWWREREAELGGTLRVAGPSPGRVRFGGAIEDGSGRRLQAMRLAYAGGMLATGTGLVSEVAVLLALGAALLNLGTIYRYLVVALDREALDSPVLARRSGFLLGDVLDQATG